MNKTINTPVDEINFKDILLKVKEVYLLLRPHFILIVILSMLGGIGGFTYAYLTPPQYVATLTFMVDAGKSSLGSASQLASSLGFGIPGTSSTLDTKKMENLILSNKINSIALFEKETINQKTGYLANHFIDLFELRKEFVENDSLKDFTEFKSADYRKFTQKENIALNVILNKISGERGSLSAEVSKNDIITVHFTSESNIFAKYYLEHLIKALTEFYVSSSTKKEKISLDIIINREDSIKKALYAAEYNYAAYKDENLGMIKVKGFIEELRLKRNIEILTTMFAEVIKSKEMATFAMLNKTPIFQVIDEPGLPLKMIRKSKLIFLIIGGFWGFLLTSCIIIFKKYRSNFL